MQRFYDTVYSHLQASSMSTTPLARALRPARTDLAPAYELPELSAHDQGRPPVSAYESTMLLMLPYVPPTRGDSRPSRASRRRDEGAHLGADDEQGSEERAREAEQAAEEGDGRRDDVAEGEAAGDAAEPDDVVRAGLLGEVLGVAQRAHEDPLGGELQDGGTSA